MEPNIKKTHIFDTSTPRMAWNIMALLIAIITRNESRTFDHHSLGFCGFLIIKRMDLITDVSTKRINKLSKKSTV